MEEVDIYEALEPVLLRPSMFFGRKSVTAFGHFYMGLTQLGGRSLSPGPFAFRMKNDLHDGFIEWVCEKRAWSRNVVSWYLYERDARRQLKDGGIDEPSTFQSEALGFDLFVADLKEFRERADG